MGGLALFIYGLQNLGGSLQEIAGKRAHKVLEVLTSVPVVGMMLGAVVTIVVQSSTLVTVMVVSFVNSSILTLKQAAAVIMGANIGTTLTAQLMAFRITDSWVYFATVGFIIYFVARRQNIKTTGLVLFSFAMLLLGLALMTDAMRPLRDNYTFINLMAAFSNNRVLGLIAGAVFTAIVQSSTAVTGVIIALTMGDVISLQAALPLILGANVGTCVTAVLASIGTSVSAKRTAAVHVVFNVVGAIVFLFFLPQFESLVLFVSPYDDISRQAANAHTLFSVITTVLFLPFINQLVKFVTLIVPGTDSSAEKDTAFIDWKLTNNPNMALGLAKKELIRMAELAGENITLAVEGFITKDKKLLKATKKKEKNVDKLEKEIVSYLAAVSQTGMGRDMSILHAGLLHAANDIERISDHARNIARTGRSFLNEELDFSEQAIDEMKYFYDLITEIYNTAINAVKENEAKPNMKLLKQQIEETEKQMRATHIARMAEGKCNIESGTAFVGIISDFKRICDHSVNISHLPQGRL